MAEIEVTAEMVEAACRVWRECGTTPDGKILFPAIYRAMEEVRRKEAVARELRRRGIADD